MNLNLYSQKGKKTEKKVKLEPEVFEVKVNNDLISQAVYVYLQNQRQANAQAKDRSEVSGGGKKPWRQKGSGRARHGSTRSPIWKGGGVTFGPTNLRNYKKKLNKKVRLAALKSALSLKSLNKEIIIIEDFKVAKSKEIVSALKNLGIEGKITFIQVEEEGLHKASKNIQNVNVIRVGELNTYEVMNNRNLIICESALDKMHQMLAGKKPVAKKSIEKPVEKVVKKTVKKAVKKTTKKTTKKIVKKTTKKVNKK